MEALSMHQDRVLEQEIFQLKEQHERDLDTHELSINLMK